MKTCYILVDFNSKHVILPSLAGFRGCVKMIDEDEI